MRVFFGLLLLCSALAPAVSLVNNGEFSIPVQQRLSDSTSWTTRSDVSAALKNGKWTFSTSAFQLDGKAASIAAAALKAGQRYHVRIPSNTSDTNPSMFVTSSIPWCTLADAEFRHEIQIDVTPDGIVRSAHIRPYVAAGYTGCRSSELYQQSVSELAPRIVAVLMEESQVLPNILTSTGVPFAGQAELTNNDILSSATGLDDDAKSSLQAQLAAQPVKEEPKSFFQQYWHIILPVGIFLFFQSMGGGGGGAAAGGPASNNAAR